MAPAQINDDEFHAFISFAYPDLDVSLTVREELTKRGFRCCHSDYNFTPAATVTANLLQGVTKSRKVLLLVSRAFVKSEWVALETNLGVLKNQSSGIVSCIPIIVEDTFKIDDPEFPKNVVAMDCLNYRNTPEFWDTLSERINTSVSLIVANPCGDVAHGLAWSYYYGFINIVLPPLKDELEKWRKKNPIPDNVICMDEMVVLIPNSCKGKGSLADYDPEHIEYLGPDVDIIQDRVGNKGRIYKLQTYRVTNPSNPQQQFHIVMNMNATVNSMYEMMQDEKSGLDQDMMLKQRFILEEKLKCIVDNAQNVNCRDKTFIFSFDDSPEAPKSLAQIVAEKCQERLRRQ